jgi:hypothetical protein
MKKSLIAFLIFFTALNMTSMGVFAAVKNTMYSYASDSSLRTLLQAKIAKVKAIKAADGTDKYYVKLMLALYNGANDMIRLQTNKGSSGSLTKRSLLIEKFHKEMSHRYTVYLSVKSPENQIDPRFKTIANAALEHFSRFPFERHRKSSVLLSALMVEFYENMDQISVAFVAVGKCENLKRLAWESIEKQNKLIELLRTRE